MNRKRRDIFVGGLTLAAVAAGLVAAFSMRTGADGSASLEDGGPPKEPPRTGTSPHVGKEAAAQAPVTAERPETDRQQTPGRGRGDFRLETLYEPVTLNFDGTFEGRTPEPALGETCARYAGPLRPGSFGTHLDSLGISGRWMTPEDVHVVDWNRHLRQGDSYAQVNVTWNQDHPPTYAVSASSGPSPVELDRPIPVYDDARPTRPLDVDVALGAAEALVARLVREGAVAGSRTMVVSDRAFDPSRLGSDAPKRVEFRNGALVAYEDPEISCGEGASGFACECPLR